MQAEKTNSKARFADDEFGINIEISQQKKNNQISPLSGEFRVPYGKNGIRARGAKLLKHIALVVTRSANYQALTPFREVVVFEDDIQESDQVCSGFFNINVADHIAFDGEGDYYILCSLGTYLSNTVKVTLS